MNTTTLTPAQISFVDQLFDTFFLRAKAPGLAYAITYKGAVIHSRALGHRTVAPLAAVCATTPFRIASMTKSFATAALLRLRNQGLVSLEATVQSVLPHLKLSEPFSSATIHQLISMALDLPVDDPWADRQMGATDQAFAEFFSQPLLRAHEGEGRCSYSNLSYFLLGRIISQVSGTSALSFISQELLRPLSLTSTFWNPTSDVLPLCALGHRWDGLTWQPEALVPTIGDGAVFAGLWTSLKDIATWLDFLRADSTPHPAYEKVLPSSSRREMQGSYTWVSPTPFTRSEDNTAAIEHPSYGYGLKHFVTDGLHYIGHSGGIPGYGSHMRISLETGFGIVAFANGTYCPTFEVCREALDFLVRKNFLPGKRMEEIALRLGERLAAHLLAGGDSSDQELFIPTMSLDYPPQEFMRDTEQRLLRIGERPSITATSITAVPGALGRMVLRGSKGEGIVQFGISPLGPPEKIQSVAWVDS